MVFNKFHTAPLCTQKPSIGLQKFFKNYQKFQKNLKPFFPKHLPIGLFPSLLEELESPEKNYDIFFKLPKNCKYSK